MPLDRVPKSAALCCFEDGERGSLRICQNRHAAHFFHGHGSQVDLGAKLAGFGSNGVAVFNRKIQHPMRRYVRITMSAGRNAADKLLTVLDLEVTGRIMLAGHDFPTE